MPDIRHFAVRFIPDEHKVAMNRYIAALNGEDILSSENISRPASPDGLEPATWWYGGAFRDAAWLETWQGLAQALPEPPNGWPVMVDNEVVLTEAEAQAAAEALRIHVSTGEWYASMGLDCLAAGLVERGLQTVEPPEDE